MGSPSRARGEGGGVAPSAYALPFARRRPHLDGSLVRELRAELGQSSSTFPRIDSYRTEPRCAIAATYSDRLEIRSLRNKERPKMLHKGEEKISLAKRFISLANWIISLAKGFCFVRCLASY